MAAQQHVIVVGSGGMLGRAMPKALEAAGFGVTAYTREQLDIRDTNVVRSVMSAQKPRAVINCAAYTRVDDAEVERDLAFQINAHAVMGLAALCAEHQSRLVFPSTDYVFDGKSAEPYATTAATHPLNEYGRSKLAGEQAAAAAVNYLVVRTCWLYGPGGRNFVRTIAGKLETGASLRVVDDQRGAPTSTQDVADAIARLLHFNARSGIYHFTNAGTATWYDFACEIARTLGGGNAVRRCTSSEFPTRARRPSYSVLDCSETDALIGPRRNWQTALAEALRAGAF